jgi:transposase
LSIRIHLDGVSGRKTVVTRRQLTDEQWKLIEPFLPIGEYGPYPERLREQCEGVIWRFRTSSQWREMPGEFGPWPTVYGRFRVWRDAGVFTALLEGVIAEAARQGKTDLSLVSVDSTTARAIMTPPGCASARRSWTPSRKPQPTRNGPGKRGAARQNRTDRTDVTTPSGKSGGTSGDGASSA